jgi:DNA-binding PadR family transcriptional regulator
MEKKQGGRRQCLDAFECVHAVSCRGGESQKFYLTLMAGALECSTESIRAMMKKCINAGWLVERMDGHSKRYEVTALGREELAKHPSPRDWRNQ